LSTPPTPTPSPLPSPRLPKNAPPQALPNAHIRAVGGLQHQRRHRRLSASQCSNRPATHTFRHSATHGRHTGTPSQPDQLGYRAVRWRIRRCLAHHRLGRRPLLKVEGRGGKEKEQKKWEYAKKWKSAWNADAREA
jgi:hypothetical protein